MSDAEAPVVDAEVVETEAVEAEALEVRPPGREVLMPMDASQVVEGMRQYQQLLKDLLDASDYQGTGKGAFPKKSAWRKISRAFNLSVTIVRIEVGRDDEGNPVRAECVARATAPNGQVSDADGYCTLKEFKGKRADDVKLENTLRATATTRAKNRAIADLVGMGEVSAEEMTPATQGPAHGPGVHAGDDTKKAKAALAYLCDGDADTALGVWSAVTAAHDDYMPAAVALSLRLAARAVKEVRDSKPSVDTSDFADPPRPEPTGDIGEEPPL